MVEQKKTSKVILWGCHRFYCIILEIVQCTTQRNILTKVDILVVVDMQKDFMSDMKEMDDHR